jgi:hypothetical protein
MRKRGPMGGGTVRRKSPQPGQRPSPLMGSMASARSQWPRASHRGLIHCTVKPGKYCIASPLRSRTARASHKTAGASRNRALAAQLCLALPSTAHRGERIAVQNEAGQGTRGNSAHDGAHCASRSLWCQEKRLQDIVVRLLNVENRERCRLAWCKKGGHYDSRTDKLLTSRME